MHRSRSRDYSQLLRFQAAELRDHLLGHAVGNEFLAWIPAEVLERQNDQHDPLLRGSCRPP
jgi:hypothetical protein